MSKELPEPWATELAPKRIHSYRELGAAVDVSHGTAWRLVQGKKISADTVRKVADSLFAGDRDKVWRLHGLARRDHGDWELPPEASLLTEEQRKAVLAVTWALIHAETKGGEGRARPSPTKTGGGPKPAPKRAPKLSAVPDRTVDAIAAHEDGHIDGEQESHNEP